ncbi:SURF1 family protein [Chelatococcus asaccharovorans]|uniref:SURF1-like protein n=1 Tax=Chelatococcus asaccharovorans TaxID=28210 RepID=A0A2V3UDF3_9HYPH|nr:SURF1 family protein [Chelatococcus asaccharovorans]MBS7702316.1 SURF1 family protein [Chelatococcus asaccharovorans]PXW56482.1 surfeit locus 1 family protein [Chelatococcus asaccharovorans]
MSRFRQFVVPALCTLVALAILLGLGFWQIERLQWKEGLIARIGTRIHDVPVAVPPEAEWGAWSAAEDEYRPVRAEGRFLNDKTVYVTANAELRPKAGATLGYMVLTPLALADGGIVIVNRGFVPRELRDSLRLDAAANNDRATVTGLMRAPQEQGWFVPDDQPSRDAPGRGDWYTRDPVRIGASLGLDRVAPFLIDEELVEGGPPWPRGGLTVISFPNKHLEYALTWFGLAATLVAVFLIWALRQRRPQSP